MLNELLDQIRAKKIYKGKSDMCSGDKWLVTIYYKGKWCKFIFHDNYKNKSSKGDFIYCLVNDALAFESCRNWVEFKREFCYGSDVQAKHAYYACEKQSNRLHRLFNQAEIDILSEIE